MIRRPTLSELIDAARSLDVTVQVAIIFAIKDQLRKSQGDVAGLSPAGLQAASDDWMSLAVESLARAYGQSEPEYSAEDLVPVSRATCCLRIFLRPTAARRIAPCCACASPQLQDLLVCGITTQLTSRVRALDEIIEKHDDDFVTTGLKAAALIRTAFLALLPPSRFQSRIGFASPERDSRLLRSLAKFLAAAAPFILPLG